MRSLPSSPRGSNPHCYPINFARDPALRQEFLHEYLSLVQFRWSQDISEQHKWQLETLPTFLHMLSNSGLRKHLTVDHMWTCSGYSRLDWREWWRIDAMRWSRLFGVLHRYKIKAEINMRTASGCRRPYMARMESLCEMHVK